MSNQISRGQWIVSMVACGLLGSVAGSVGLSFADNLATTSSVLGEGVVVPYDGYLMLDSTPVNEPAQILRFSLYESPSGGTAQWVETQTVSVNGGRFSAALGKGTKVSSEPVNATFNEVILDAEKLYIGIEVDDGTGSFIELAGRQAIEATPFAAWAATSADFTVKNNAQVEGSLGVTNNASVGGTTNLNTLNTTGATSVGGVLTATQGIELGSDQDITGADVIEGANDLRLMGAPNSPHTNGDLNIAANGDVTVAEDLTVNGTYKNLTGSMTLFSYELTSNNVINLIPVNEGFCMLTEVEIQAYSSGALSCRVFRSPNGFWRLVNNESGGAGRLIDCQAECVRFN